MSEAGAPAIPAVLVLACRRPVSTERLLRLLRSEGLSDIYVAVDGPKPAAGDAQRVEGTREVVRRFGLPQKNLLLRDANLGGPRGIPEAIDWFFSANDRGLIIEDDLLPHPSFLRFAAELLQRYADDPRVAAIHGWSSQLRPPPQSYYFSRYAPGWGWATWASRWKDFDRESRLWAETDPAAVLGAASQGDASFVEYWTEVLRRVYVEGTANWDYRWTYTNYALGRLTAVAGVNLVENTGFGEGATHTVARPHYLLPVAAMAFPLRHPSAVAPDVPADRHLHRTVFMNRRWEQLRYRTDAVLRRWAR